MYGSITDGRQYASFFVPISNQIGDPRSTGYSYSRGYMGDYLIFNTWRGSFCFRTPPIAIVDCLGIFNFQAEKPDPNLFRTIRPLPVKYDAGLDYSVNAGGQSRRNSGAKEIRSSVLHEKGVSHTRYEGTVVDIPNPQDLTHYIPVGDAWLGPSGYYPGVSNQRTSDYLTPYTFTYSGISDQGKLGFDIGYVGDTGYDGVYNRVGVTSTLTGYLDALKSLMETYGYLYYSLRIGGYHPHVYTWESLTYSEVVGLQHIDLKVNYVFTHYRGDWPYYTAIDAYDVETSFRLYWSPVYGSNSIYDANFVHEDFFRLAYESKATLKSTIGSPYGDEPVHVPLTYSFAGRPSVSDSYPVTDSGLPNFENFRRQGSTYTHRQWQSVEKVFYDRLADVRPSQYLAFSDALENQIQLLSSNNIQNLKELKGILDLAPDLPEFLRILARVFRGDASAIVDLIDYLTELILKINFGILPNARDVKDLIDSDVAKKLDALTHTEGVTGYGSFLYQFTDEENPFGDGLCYLRTRYKGRFTINSGTLMMMVLASNSLGLLPTLSRVWEVLPFSFIVDWVFNMKARIKQIDNLAISSMCAVTEWNLTSYKLLYRPSDEFLATYGLRSSADDPFFVSVYRREFSLYAPRLRGSHFDFLRAVHRPDTVTVGSLAWQLNK